MVSHFYNFYNFNSLEVKPQEIFVECINCNASGRTIWNYSVCVYFLFFFFFFFLWGKNAFFFCFFFGVCCVFFSFFFFFFFLARVKKTYCFQLISGLSLSVSHVLIMCIQDLRTSTLKVSRNKAVVNYQQEGLILWKVDASISITQVSCSQRLFLQLIFKTLKDQEFCIHKPVLWDSKRRFLVIWRGAYFIITSKSRKMLPLLL